MTIFFILVKVANTVFSFTLSFFKNIFSFTQDAFSIRVVINAIRNENGFFDWQNQRNVVLLANIGRNENFVIFANGQILIGQNFSLAFSAYIIPFVTRLALSANVIYLIDTVSNELLGAALAFVRVLHIPFLTLDALVVFLVLTILNFGNAERMLVEFGQDGSVGAFFTVHIFFHVL